MAPNRRKSVPARFRPPKPGSLEATNPNLADYLKRLDAKLNSREGRKPLLDKK